MGLLDNLFKSKPEAGAEKAVETSGNPGPGEQHAPAAKGSPFLAPKIYIPRSSVQIVPPTRSQLQTERRLEPVPAALGAPREIVLTLGDVLSRIPPHFLQPGTPDARRELRFPADGLAADIARGRASVFLAEVIAQCPDVFLPEADDFDDIQIRLPLQKLVEQIGRAGISRPAISADTQPPVPEMPLPEVDPEPPGEEQIHLSLAAILKRCPKEIIVAPLPPIDESVRVTFPFPPIANQLATGQVEVSSLRFIAALPLDLMKCFEAKAGVKVPLPLEEIFQHLPDQTPPPALGPSAREQDRAFQNAKLAESILLGAMDAPLENGTSVLETDALLSGLPAPAEAGNVVIAGNFAAPLEVKVHAPPVVGPPAISFSEIPVALPKVEVESALAAPPVFDPEIAVELPKVEAPLQIENKLDAPVPNRVVLDEGAITAAPPIDASVVRPFVPWLRPPVLLAPKTGSEEIPPAPAVLSEPEPEPPQAFQPPTESVAPEPPPVAPAPVAAESAALAAAALRIGPPKFRPMVVLPPRVIASPLDSPAPLVPEPLANPEPEPVAEVSHIAPEPPARAKKSVGPRALDGKVRELFASDSPLELPRVGQLLATLPGIRGCVIAAPAVEFHSGELPTGLDAPAIRDIGQRMHCALAEHSGHVQHVTLHGEDYSLSFFTRGKACVCAVHRAQIFLPGVREKFAAVAEELSRGF